MDFFTLKTQKNKDTINFNPVVPMRPYSSLTVGRLGQTLLTLLLPVCSYSALTQSEAGANPVNPPVAIPVCSYSALTQSEAGANQDGTVFCSNH